MPVLLIQNHIRKTSSSIMMGLVVWIATFAPVVSAVNETVVLYQESWKYLRPDGYKRADPPQKDGAPASVYVKLQINDVEDINENQMYFVLDCFILEVWNDFRLTVENFPRGFPYHFSAEGSTKIWKPDTTFENSKSGQVFPISVPNVVIQLQKDASLFRLTRYSLKIGCFMHFHHFPMDTQHCEFIINLFSTTDQMATLHWIGERGSPYKNFAPSIEVASGIQPLQFYFSKPKPDKRVADGIFGKHTHLVANFTFARRVTGNVVSTYIPSGLVVVISWVSFWLDVNAVPGRITLGVTSILTLSTTVVQSRSNVRVNYLRALDIWLFVCLVMVFSSLIEYAAAYHYSRTRQLSKKPKASPTDSTKKNLRIAWINSKIIPRKDSVFPLQVRKYAPTAEVVSLVKHFPSSDDSLAKSTDKTEKSENVTPLDRYARIVFPLCFLCFVITYWAYYLIVLTT